MNVSTRTYNTLNNNIVNFIPEVCLLQTIDNGATYNTSLQSKHNNMMDFHPYQLDETISNICVVGWYLVIFIQILTEYSVNKQWST